MFKNSSKLLLIIGLIGIIISLSLCLVVYINYNYNYLISIIPLLLIPSIAMLAANID